MRRTKPIFQIAAGWSRIYCSQNSRVSGLV